MEWIGPPDYLCEREPIDSFGIGQFHRIAGHGQRDRTEFWRRCFEPADVHDQSIRGPALTSGSLANGATYVSGGLVPGSWAQVKGKGLSPVSRTWTSADFQGLGNNLPMSLNGVSVTVNNQPAAVYSIDPGQISFGA